MKITFKLFANLTDYLPTERKYNAIELDVASTTTIGDLVSRFNLPEKQVHLVLINGVYVEPPLRPTCVLQEGDVVAIWPPVAGG
jgi:molybdopterin converting factor small subunit